MDTPKHSVSVAGIVVDDQGRVLVIKRRDNGHWEPPGGVLELNETPEQGVTREVFEESGIEVVVDTLSGIYKNMQHGIVSLVFRCSTAGGIEQTGEESSEVAWKTTESLRELMAPAYLVRVTDAFDSVVPVRVHDGWNVIPPIERPSSPAPATRR